MAGFSTYLANATLTTHLSSAAPYVTVSTTEVLDDGTGGGTMTPVQAVTFGAPVGGIASSTSEVTFTGVDAGTYAYLQIWNNATKTNLLFSDGLTTSREADDGDNLVFAVGEIVATLT